jgi:hypothetical protein
VDRLCETASCGVMQGGDRVAPSWQVCESALTFKAFQGNADVIVYKWAARYETDPSCDFGPCLVGRLRWKPVSG